MTLIIKTLRKNNEGEYNFFLRKSNNSLFYHSLKYKKFLEDILKNSSAKYFLLYENKKIVAALPFFLMRSSNGNILNSLPFYGSNGGIIYINKLKPKYLIKLFSYLDEFIKKNKIISTLIIPNFLEKKNLIKHYFKHNFEDIRISQITHLPKRKNYSLMDFIKSKSLKRNIKYKFNDFVPCIDNSLGAFKKIYELHKKQSIFKKRIYKKWNFFKLVRKNFKQKEDYNLYCIKTKDEIIAGVLIFYYKNLAEYYLPVSDDNYDKYSLIQKIIFKSMQDCIDKDYSIWNWGSTWINQNGVFEFKNKWNTSNNYFKYMIKTTIDKKDINKNKILNNYEYFYVVPFS